MSFQFLSRAFSRAAPVRRKLSRSVAPTGVERTFGKDELIVSKTDLKGHINYVNDVFVRISGYAESEMIGAPHSVIRHPDMPRCVFKLLWDRLHERREVFAYVKNMSVNGDHYWVFAHVTVSVSDTGEPIGYHSNRRVADRQVLEQTIVPLYDDLLREEQGHEDRKAGLEASYAKLKGIWEDRGQDYDRFILSL